MINEIDVPTTAIVEPSTVLHGLHTLHIDGQPVAIAFPHDGKWLVDRFDAPPEATEAFDTETAALAHLNGLTKAATA